MKILYTPDEIGGNSEEPAVRHSFDTESAEADKELVAEESVVEEPVIEEPVIEEPVIEEAVDPLVIDHAPSPEKTLGGARGDFNDHEYLKTVLSDNKISLEDVCVGRLSEVLLNVQTQNIESTSGLGDWLRTQPLRKYNRLVGCGIDEHVLALFL
jgi:hypothetical protein